MAPVLSEEFLDIQATIECRFTLKLVCNMIIPYTQTYSLQVGVIAKCKKNYSGKSAKIVWSPNSDSNSSPGFLDGGKKES